MENQIAAKQYRDDDGKIDVLALYDEFHDKLFRYALNRTGDVEVARDITADVFLKAHKNRWKFVFTGAPVSAWLYKIAGNEIISFQRRSKFRPLALEQELQKSDVVPLSLRGDLHQEIMVAQEYVSRNAAFQRIQKQIEKLPNKYQEVIVLRFLEEKSVKEVARLLGKKEGTVKSLLSRGLNLLKKNSKSIQDVFSSSGILAEPSPNEGVRLS